jgi:putative ABC transport system substrate-binding protein
VTSKICWLLLSSFLLAFALPAKAQQTNHIVRLGYLSGARAATDFKRSQGIGLALRGLGYVEGQNLAIEYRYADEKLDRLPKLAAELAHLRVDIIVAAGGRAIIEAAMNATKTIPIVMTGQGPDPVRAGFIKSLAHPGGNVTGVTNLLVSLGGKRLELLKESIPKLARVSLPYVPGNQTHQLELKEVQKAAQRLGVAIQTFAVRGAEDFDIMFAAIGRQRPDALQMLGGPVTRENRKRIVDFTVKTRLPSMWPHDPAVEAGGLMYYGEDPIDSYRLAAYYVDRILKGAKPASLPVEQPTKFELVINLKTAQQIGLAIPPSILARANRVIR